ncbi:hypothetical protein V8G54_034330, partial [Vigna mungo]
MDGVNILTSSMVTVPFLMMWHGLVCSLCIIQSALESSRRRDGGISPDGHDFAPLWLSPSLLTGTNRIGHSTEAVELDSWEKYLFSNSAPSGGWTPSEYCNR